MLKECSTDTPYIKLHEQYNFLMNSDFWDVTPCSPIKVHSSFGETYCLLLHDQGIRPHETSKKQATSRGDPED
jgi:hypothetical protein